MNRLRINHSLRNSSLVLAFCCFAAIGRADGKSQGETYQFDFADGKSQPPAAYDGKFGFGFGTTAMGQAGDGLTSEKSFYLSAVEPEGNYLVTTTFGDRSIATTNTVKAECRRLMVENLVTKPGEFMTRSFVVNIRTPIYPGGKVHLKPREQTNEVMTWDDKLTLEFSGTHPVLRALKIVPDTKATTLYVAGDSTVCDQPLEPWNSWGQMLPRFFDSHVAVANYAESGESIRSSLGAHRFDKIFSLAKPGDFLFVQFGHNDMKEKATNALAVYKENLRRIVVRAREAGMVPVLITPMERKAGINGNTLAGYPDTVRAVAHENSVALIDLNAASLKLYHALGDDLDLAFQDGTHHNDYGSYELARCVVEGIKQNRLELARYIAPDAAAFDPAKPDDVHAFHIPQSPMRDNTKPEGN